MHRLFLNTLNCVSGYLLFWSLFLIGRQVVPLFGGSATIWCCALVFFSFALAAGCLYIHIAIRFLSFTTFTAVHVLLLGLSIFVDPNYFSHANYIFINTPISSLFSTLLCTSTLPLILLSATAPLAQKLQKIDSDKSDDDSLYSAFAFSGLAALFIHVFVIETYLGLNVAKNLWSVGYTLYVLMLIYLLWFSCKQGKASNTTVNNTYHGGLPLIIKGRWLATSVLSGALLLSGTHIILKETVVLPFFALVPMFVYLAAISLVFSTGSKKHPVLESTYPYVIVLYILYTPLLGQIYLHITFLLLFIALLLINSKNVETFNIYKKTALFYTYSSIGLFVGTSLGLLLSYNLLGYDFVFNFCLILTVISLSHSYKSLALRSFFGTLVTIYLLFFFSIFPFSALLKKELSTNSPFGWLRVIDASSVADVKILQRNGIIIGAQSTLPDKYNVQMLQNKSLTNIAEAFNTTSTPVNIAFIGSSVGGLSCMFGDKAVITYIDVDRKAQQIMRNKFNFIDSCKAKSQMVVSHPRELFSALKGSKIYDLIIIDQHFGVAIPYDYLTVEAISKYVSSLKDDGVIAVHTSAKYVNFNKLLDAQVQKLNLHGSELTYLLNIRSILKQSMLPGEDNVSETLFGSWYFIAKDPSVMTKYSLRQKQGLQDSSFSKYYWSDNSINILPYLNINGR